MTDDRFLGLRIHDGGGVRFLTLDRLAVKNAFNDDLYDAVRQALETAATDPSIAVVLITGAGDIFSAGEDLNVLAGLHDTSGVGLALDTSPDPCPPSISR